MAFVQTVPIELAFLFAGDTLTYLEFVVILRLAAGREHFLHALHLAARLVRFAARMASAAIDRSITAINGRRERRTPARPAKPRCSDPSDDGRGFAAAWGALATA